MVELPFALPEPGTGLACDPTAHQHLPWPGMVGATRFVTLARDACSHKLLGTRLCRWSRVGCRAGASRALAIRDRGGVPPNPEEKQTAAEWSVPRRVPIEPAGQSNIPIINNQTKIKHFNPHMHERLRGKNSPKQSMRR